MTARIERALLGHIECDQAASPTRIDLWGSRVHRVMCCMAVLVVLAAARAVCTVCWEGSPYVLFGAWVILFCVFGPQIFCGIFRGLYSRLGMESEICTVPMDLSVPNYL
jgi:hypothetical protein